MDDKDPKDQTKIPYSLGAPATKRQDGDKYPATGPAGGATVRLKGFDGGPCPYLGLIGDRYSHFSFPEMKHRCFGPGPGSTKPPRGTGATSQENAIPLEHQATFCFTYTYRSCSRFAETPGEPGPIPLMSPSAIAPVPGVGETKLQKLKVFSSLRVMLWLLAGLLAIFIATAYYSSLFLQESPVIEPLARTIVLPTATTGSTPDQEIMSLAEAIEMVNPTQVPISNQAEPTATSTPVPDGRIYALSPAASDIGWVTSGEERGNHFGDSFLYAGIFDNQIYQSAFQFNLSSIPRGAPIYQASLQLTGLSSDRLGQDGTWSLRLLDSEIDEDWRKHNFQQIFNAPALQTLSPILGTQDLAVGRTNIFELSASQRAVLETRIIDYENPRVSFRLEGPLVGPNNLFVWDTGYGSLSQANKATLFLNVGSPPATPPLFDYIVVTSTPTPENVITVAALVQQITADAARYGTATPIPFNMVTATPFPEYLIIIPTSTPENAATARARAGIATAEAMTTGTPTPISTNAVTATPRPTETPTPRLNYVLITATPTAETIFAAATLSAAETAQAQHFGTPTPLPTNWVTPIVVTSTPNPANGATAQFLAALATAQAFTTGTPTPTPSNMVTATPTPIFILFSELSPLTATPTPTTIPEQLPLELIGKIAFKSDRTGEVKIFVINPDGTGLAMLTDQWPYDRAREADAYSSDGRFRVFTKNAIRYRDENGEGKREDVPTLYWYDAHYNVEEQLVLFGKGIAYDGVWSPTREQIAFVSNDSSDDEIWVIDRDRNNRRQLTESNAEYNAREIGKDTFVPEVNKHPSWSPDGSQIVFWSTRTRHAQLWIMNADGSNAYNLSQTDFNDWDPVWIKYPRVPKYE